MNKKVAFIACGFLFIAVLSCSTVLNKIASGGPEMNKADELWSDVPRMDDMTHSDIDMPITIKFALKTVLNNLWRVNNDKEDKTPVSGDWVIYSTSQPPSAVQAFYTNERMTNFGKWEANKASTCVDGKDKGAAGVVCIFQRKVDKKESLLAIMAALDDKTKKTNIFFLRLEKDGTAASSQSSGGK